MPERSGARHVILAYGNAHTRAFTHEDARFLEAMAHVLARALDRDGTETELRRQALEDPLTGLGNRALLTSQLDAELRHGRRLGNRVCVLALDLDRFKDVNDGLGHRIGDALLRQVAARLRACVRDEDLLARPGADEFCVVATRTDSDQAVAALAQRLLDAVAAPFSVEGDEVFLTASVGVAVSEAGSDTAEELLRSADAALSRARRAGGARTTPRMQPTATGSWSGWRSKETSDTPSSAANSSCITNHSSTCPMSESSDLRRCCAGATRTGA